MINFSGSDDKDDKGLLISTIVLAVVAGILLLMLAVMFVMGRRKSKGPTRSGPPEQSLPQTQSPSAVPPQLVVDEPKHPVQVPAQDPYEGTNKQWLMELY